MSYNDPSDRDGLDTEEISNRQTLDNGVSKHVKNTNRLKSLDHRRQHSVDKSMLDRTFVTIEARGVTPAGLNIEGRGDVDEEPSAEARGAIHAAIDQHREEEYIKSIIKKSIDISAVLNDDLHSECRSTGCQKHYEYHDMKTLGTRSELPQRQQVNHDTKHQIILEGKFAPLQSQTINQTMRQVKIITPHFASTPRMRNRCMAILGTRASQTGLE